MTDYEPYVAEPLERRRPPALARFRPLLAWLILLILVGAAVGPALRDAGTQDPSFDVPIDADA